MSLPRASSLRILRAKRLPLWGAFALLGAVCTLPVACGSDPTSAVEGPVDASLSDAPPVPDARPVWDAPPVDATHDTNGIVDAGPADAGHRCSELGEARGTAVSVVAASLNAVSFAVAEGCATYVATPTDLSSCAYAGCSVTRPVLTVAAAAAGMPVVTPADPTEYFMETPSFQQVFAVGAELHVLVNRPVARPLQGGGLVMVDRQNSRAVDPLGFGGSWDGLSAQSNRMPPRPISLQHENGELIRRIPTIAGSPGAGVTHRDLTGTFYLMPDTWSGGYMDRSRHPRNTQEAYMWSRAGGPRPPEAGLCRGTWAAGSGDAGVDAGTLAPTFSCAAPPAGTTLPAWLATVTDVIPLDHELLVIRNLTSLSRCAYPAPGAPATTLCHDETQLSAVPPSGSMTPFVAYTAHGGIYSWVSASGDAGADTSPGGGTSKQLVFCSEADLLANTCAWAPLGPPQPADSTVIDEDADHVYVGSQRRSLEVVRIAK